MGRRVADRSIRTVLGAIFLLGIAYGVSISLIALHLDARGYSKEDIGSLAAFFALGIVTLSLPMGALVRRLSARRTLLACIVGYAAAAASLAYAGSYALLAAVRFFDGAFSVGVWVSCETILLARSPKDDKAFIMSLYAIALAFGYVVGPLAAKLVVAAMPMSVAFVTSGAIALLAAALVAARLEPDVAGAAHASHAIDLHEPAATPSDDPAPAEERGGSAPSSWLRVLWRIKTSCLATFSYGYFQASVVLFLPLHLVEAKAVPMERTLYVPAFFAAGMLAFSNLAGRLGDRHGHLFMMRGMAAVGTAMILGFVLLDSFAVMCAAVFVAGASLASISPLSLGLQGVVTAPRDYSRANALYNAFYAAGMLIGPPISSRIYGARGGGAMLYHLAALWAGFVAFTVVFRRDDPNASRGSPRARAAVTMTE